MEAAAAFKDALNGVQATTIEQCMKEGENEEALNHALDLLTKPYLSLYHKGVAHLALATLCLPQAQSGHATLDIKFHIRSALESFQRLLLASARNPPPQPPPPLYNNPNSHDQLQRTRPFHSHHPLDQHPLSQHPLQRPPRSHPQRQPTSHPRSEPTSHPSSVSKGQLPLPTSQPPPLPPHPAQELNPEMSFIYDAPPDPDSNPSNPPETNPDTSTTYSDEDSEFDTGMVGREILGRQIAAVGIERLLECEARTLALREEHRRWVRFGERNGERETEGEEYEDSVEMVEMSGREGKGDVVVGEREVDTSMVGFV